MTKRVRPVEVCVTVTSTPGSAAPDSSVTTPEICAMATVCADDDGREGESEHDKTSKRTIRPPEIDCGAVFREGLYANRYGCQYRYEIRRSRELRVELVSSWAGDFRTNRGIVGPGRAAGGRGRAWRVTSSSNRRRVRAPAPGPRDGRRPRPWPTTVIVARSTNDTSLEGPLAVKASVPSGETARPQGRSPTATDPASVLVAVSMACKGPAAPGGDQGPASVGRHDHAHRLQGVGAEGHAGDDLVRGGVEHVDTCGPFSALT